MYSSLHEIFLSMYVLHRALLKIGEILFNIACMPPSNAERLCKSYIYRHFAFTS